MRGLRDTYRRKDKCVHGFGGETRRKETNVETGEWVINRVGWRRGLDLFGSGNAQEVGWCEHGCELSGCIKWGLGRVP
jgi:hypothetical protein